MPGFTANSRSRASVSSSSRPGPTTSVPAGARAAHPVSRWCQVRDGVCEPVTCWLSSLSEPGGFRAVPRAWHSRLDGSEGRCRARVYRSCSGCSGSRIEEVRDLSPNCRSMPSRMRKVPGRARNPPFCAPDHRVCCDRCCHPVRGRRRKAAGVVEELFHKFAAGAARIQMRVGDQVGTVVTLAVKAFVLPPLPMVSGCSAFACSDGGNGSVIEENRERGARAL